MTHISTLHISDSDKKNYMKHIISINAKICLMNDNECKKYDEKIQSILNIQKLKIKSLEKKYGFNVVFDYDSKMDEKKIMKEYNNFIKITKDRTIIIINDSLLSIKFELYSLLCFINKKYIIIPLNYNIKDMIQSIDKLIKSDSYGLCSICNNNMTEIIQCYKCYTITCKDCLINNTCELCL
jgi:hypothetical protein